MRYDAVIIGGGFYGCALAAHLRSRFSRVLIVEQEQDLLQRASFNNQARIHNGYHYPRSFRTAARSRVHLPNFVFSYRDCVDAGFEKIYCIARRNSKVTAHQFERFCRIIGAPLKPAPDRVRRLFNEDLIEQVYLAVEYAFNSEALKVILERQLEAAHVAVRLGTKALRVETRPNGEIVTETDTGDTITSSWLFNCTYSGLMHIQGLNVPENVGLKHQITEMCLVEPPEEIAHLGITVMDGPFWSTLPFPARGLHSLSHVRYTPHLQWQDQGTAATEPYSRLANYTKTSRFRFMVNDAQRYCPIVGGMRYRGSLYEIKTLFLGGELDDSRPILFGCDPLNPRVISILGGKIDNIFDMHEFLDEELGLIAAA